MKHKPQYGEDRVAKIQGCIIRKIIVCVTLLIASIIWFAVSLYDTSAWQVIFSAIFSSIFIYAIIRYQLMRENNRDLSYYGYLSEAKCSAVIVPVMDYLKQLIWK